MVDWQSNSAPYYLCLYPREKCAVGFCGLDERERPTGSWAILLMGGAKEGRQGRALPQPSRGALLPFKLFWFCDNLVSGVPGNALCFNSHGATQACQPLGGLHSVITVGCDRWSKAEMSWYIYYECCFRECLFLMFLCQDSTVCEKAESFREMERINTCRNQILGLRNPGNIPWGFHRVSSCSWKG